MSVKGGQVSAEPRSRLCASGRAARCDNRSARRRVSRRSPHAASTARSAIRRHSCTGTTNISSCITTSSSTEARIGSSSAPTTSICTSDPSNRITREVFSHTPGSSVATLSRISCSATRRRPWPGIGRGDQNGRTNWLHLFAQDDWRIRAQPHHQLGLRYEYNQHMRDESNRLSSVDYVTPGGRFVIASDENGNINPEAQASLPLIPIPYITSHEAGWERGLLSPSRMRLAPANGICAGRSMTTAR